MPAQNRAKSKADITKQQKKATHETNVEDVWSGLRSGSPPWAFFFGRNKTQTPKKGPKMSKKGPNSFDAQSGRQTN